MSETLTQHLVSCKIDEKIHHGSDHRPVATHLTLPLEGRLQMPALRRL
jgi:exonuclease III